MNELGAIASSYLALITLRFGEEEDFMPVLRRMAILERYLSKKHAAADFTTALAEEDVHIRLLRSPAGDSAASGELFSRLNHCSSGPRVMATPARSKRSSTSVAPGPKDSSPMRSERVESIYWRLSQRLPNSDPWLPLFIHHEAAKSALTSAFMSMPSTEDIEQHIRMDLPLPERRQDLFAWLQAQYFDHGTAERDAMLRALAHLEAAEPLSAEFQTDEVALQHLWLWSHALIHTDPIRGIDMILEAYGRAMRREDFNRAGTMIMDALYLVCQLSRSSEPRERVQACIDRAVMALLEPEALRQFSAGIALQEKERIVTPINLLSRIAVE